MKHQSPLSPWIIALAAESATPGTVRVMLHLAAYDDTDCAVWAAVHNAGFKVGVHGDISRVLRRAIAIATEAAVCAESVIDSLVSDSESR